MKNLFKGLTVIGLAALMVGCGAANQVNNTTSSEKVTVQQTTIQKETNTDNNTVQVTSTSTSTNSSLLNKFAPGTYCVAVEGMRARAAATVNAEVVESNFQQGVALNIVEVKVGDDDADSVWGRVEYPFQGWICLQDGNMQYLMTQEQYAQSGIKTNASPVYQEGIGSGVYANPSDPAEQQGIGSGVYANPDDSAESQGIGSGVYDNADEQLGIGSGVYDTTEF